MKVVSTPLNATISIEVRSMFRVRVFIMGRGVAKCFQSTPSGRQPHMRTAGGQEIPLASAPPNVVPPSAVWG